MARFRSTPMEIEAWQYDGPVSSATRIPGDVPIRYDPKASDPADVAAEVWVQKSQTWCLVRRGDWIVREPDNSGYYPCEAEVFRRRWQLIEDGPA